MRQQDAKIYEWVTGIDPVGRDASGKQIFNNAPYYRSDADTIALLPVLVEKGYRTDLYDTQEYWAFGIEGVGVARILAKEETISRAILAAVMKLIESI